MKAMKWTGALAAVVVLGACDDITGDRVIQGRGAVLSEERNVSPFSGLNNSTLADIEILQGPSEGLVIQAQENLLDHLRTSVEGGVLRVYTENNVQLRSSEPIIIELDVVELQRIISSGSGHIDAPILDADRLEITTSGSGDITLSDLLADSLIVISSGSGRVFATGDALRLRVESSGSGPVDTRSLAALVVDATVAGSGDAFVRARDILRATLSGAGWLRYWGSPTVQQTVTGSGRVQRQGS